jgi:hypothetical protein
MARAFRNCVWSESGSFAKASIFFWLIRYSAIDGCSETYSQWWFDVDFFAAFIKS